MHVLFVYVECLTHSQIPKPWMNKDTTKIMKYYVPSQNNNENLQMLQYIHTKKGKKNYDPTPQHGEQKFIAFFL